MIKKKIKPGDLILINMDPNVDKSRYYVDLPVVVIKKNKNINTWLCLLPNKTFGGFHPEEMNNITLK